MVNGFWVWHWRLCWLPVSQFFIKYIYWITYTDSIELFSNCTDFFTILKYFCFWSCWFELTTVDIGLGKYLLLSDNWIFMVTCPKGQVVKKVNVEPWCAAFILTFIFHFSFCFNQWLKRALWENNAPLTWSSYFR